MRIGAYEYKTESRTSRCTKVVNLQALSTHGVDGVADEVVAAHVEAEVGRRVRRVHEERDEREAPLVRHADAVVEEQASHLRRRPQHEVVLCTRIT